MSQALPTNWLRQPHDSALAAFREREKVRKATRAANFKRLSEVMARWAECPDDGWCELEATDAAYIVFETDDLHTRLKDLMHDMGLDEEGYPLTDEGDRNWSADRRYVPMAACTVSLETELEGV